MTPEAMTCLLCGATDDLTEVEVFQVAHTVCRDAIACACRRNKSTPHAVQDVGSGERRRTPHKGER